MDSGLSDKSIAVLGMNLHDYFKFSETMTVLKVPGGWVYNQLFTKDKEVIEITSVFVPEKKK